MRSWYFATLLVAACLPATLGGCAGTLHPGKTTRRAEAWPPISWPARDIERARAAAATRVVPIGMGAVLATKAAPGDPWAGRSSGFSYRFVTYGDRPEIRRCLPEREGEPAAEGSRIALALPRSTPRGILLFLTGMAGARPRSLMDWAASRGLAFIEVKSSSMDTPGAPLRIDSTNQLPRAADEFAAAIDDRLAESSYAAEGAIKFFCQEHPALADLPIVVVGASAGAISAPAAIARLDGRVAAAVLIGGGADLCRISLRSAMARKLVPIAWGGQTSYLDDARLDSLYRRRTRLDPLVLAPCLGGIPVLNIYATADSLVPTEACEELQMRLGEPDSIRYAGGHMWMFLLIQDDSRVLAAWIDKHLSRSVSGG